MLLYPPNSQSWVSTWSCGMMAPIGSVFETPARIVLLLSRKASSLKKNTLRHCSVPIMASNSMGMGNAFPCLNFPVQTLLSVLPSLTQLPSLTVCCLSGCNLANQEALLLQHRHCLKFHPPTLLVWSGFRFRRGMFARCRWITWP